MHPLRRYRFLLVFLILLVFCSVMVVRQINQNQRRHVELREAFILLYTKGYKGDAEKLYTRLINAVPKLKQQQLLDDFERTLLLVDPMSSQPENLIWNYHWTVSNELERNAQSHLERARKLAAEK